MSRYPGLRDSQDGRQFSDVQPLRVQQPQDAETRVVPEKTKERGSCLHDIYKSICIDACLSSDKSNADRHLQGTGYNGPPGHTGRDLSFSAGSTHHEIPATLRG